MTIVENSALRDLGRIQAVRDRYLSLAGHLDFGLYQPVPFPEFADLAPRRNSCAQRLSMMMQTLPVERWKGMRVLDLGSNIGYFAFEWAKRGASVTAIEYVRENSEFAKEIAQVYGLECVFINAPVTVASLSQLDGHFDVVICLALMHHIYFREGLEAGRQILGKISDISDRMFFEVGQPNERRRALAWKRVMRTALGFFPRRGIVREVLAHTTYTSHRLLGYTMNHRAKRWNFLFEK